MKRIDTYIIGLAALLLAMPAAAETIRRSLPAGDAPQLRIINAVGEIVVRGTSTDSIDIDAELGRDVERLDVSERGELVIIEAIYEGRGWRSDGTDIEVTLPENASVSVEAVSADVDVAGVRGELRLTSVSGDVDAEVFGSPIEASSTSGDVTVRGHLVESEARINSVSGDVEVSELAGRLEAGVVSGDLIIAGDGLSRVRAQAVSGDLEIRGLRTGSPDIDANAVSGSIEITLGGDFGGRIDVTTLNGSIDNCFGPKPQRTSRYGPGRTLNFEHGSGSGRLNIETVNGDIELCIE